MSVETQPASDGKSAALQERARRAWLWILQYWQALFDFSFERYMIIQMLPILYGMLLFAMGAGIIYLIVEAFASGSHIRGFFYLFFAGPLTFLVLASLLRALLEFYMVIFRIAEDVDELLGVRDTVDKLSGVSDTIDEMASITRRIPFWKLIFGSSAAQAQQRRLNAARTRAAGESTPADRRQGERRAGERRPDGSPPDKPGG